MKVQSEGNAEVSSIRSAVVFDPEDGTILHVHTVVTMAGADETTEDELERLALAGAVQRGITTDPRSVLQIDPTQLEAHVRYRVNIETRALEQEQEQQRGSS